MIHILDEPTINQIAAGEVVERPSAVVKELVENAIDAGSTAITVEIKEGGLSLIRITDNGSGIDKEDISLAFLRHATSKIRSAMDLLSVTSLGFRGEALSSIAAVAQVELITKTPSSLNGYRYMIEGGEEKSMEEIGCPGGTTIIVRNLFYNTPARRKFLKSPTTEAGYISDLMERLMISHPGISFKFIANNQVKLQSSGNNNSKDILYHVYGRDIARELLPVDFESPVLKFSGYIGKPVINRGNRNFENYFINGRYIKSTIITKAIEEAYRPFLMQHKYPFTSLYIEIDPSLIDVNVHPQKLEIRLKNSEDIYRLTIDAIRGTISKKEMIPKVSFVKPQEIKKEEHALPEPFEENRRKQMAGAGEQFLRETSEYKTASQSGQMQPHKEGLSITASNITKALQVNNKNNIEINNKGFNNSDRNINNNSCDEKSSVNAITTSVEPVKNAVADRSTVMEQSHSGQMHNNILKSDAESHYISELDRQVSLFEVPKEESQAAPFLSKEAIQEHRIIGQVFSTYWLVEYKKELFIIDQHAAHEKVLYEKLMKAAREKTFESQLLLPPIVISLTLREQEILKKYEEILNQIGYEFEPFGGNEYSIRAVPADLYGLSEKDLLLEFLDDLIQELGSTSPNPTSVLEKVASLSCKAAIKANHTYSIQEASALIKELLTLENPYNCPHGRPVIISMSQYELEKKFKRIV